MSEFVSGIFSNDRLLIETDSPFIKIANQIFNPLNIRKIVEGIAKIKEENGENMQNILWNNFLNLTSNDK